MDLTNDRKIEHIQAFDRDPGIERDGRYFDRLQLMHRALPEINLSDVNPVTHFLNKPLSFPLLISSMTGGDHALVRKINVNLAQAAEQCQVAMAVGSQRVMFVETCARASFELRQYAPSIPLLANLGAVQLNYGFGLTQCEEAVACLAADGLFLHLNPLQEAVQPEGDTRFANLSIALAAIQKELSVPVLLKEVGAGLSPADVELGLAAGISYFDVAGCGGTSWSRIEHQRRQQQQDDLGLKFQDWGIPTPQALELLAPYHNRATLIASGGIRNGIDMVKSVILGARLCGVAAPLLQPAMESTEAVIAAIERLRREFVTAMFLLGVADIDTLYGNNRLLLKHFKDV